ncbi:aerobic respiration two-component sensor histidine kinase ArcB [Thaumasiovibrio subtropicus]|uniref:aerobic respiration two-component sensor histidine kinase ArcB n=1 Tax=Thaumasiovibrio subtropicus TaxID=1891207 RepID=UPI000B34DA6C|nr:aerobic respiration two-component sensor histidine kinase ArcB [Thaumasiovibrio subtropicus]
MKQIKILAQYYVDLMVKLGLMRFSMLLAIALVALAVVMQVSITLILNGSVHDSDILRSVFFGLLITPWAVYFLSVVVDQLEDSRQRLSKLVSKLEEMRGRDLELNQQLQANITKLNQEIEERQKVEMSLQIALEDLESEVFHREKAQLDLAEQSVLLRSFLDASPDLIYYRNEEFQFSGCNKAVQELTGKTEKELVGLTPADVYSEEEATRIIETDKQVFESNISLTYEQWLKYPDGRQAYFELRKVPFYNRSGKRLGLMGFGRDITERKRHQESLEKASRDKTAFISTISHELRTPLNGIVGLSRMLLDTRLSDEQRTHLRTIHVSAITLGNIFNDIIDMDKFDRRKMELLPKPTNFHDFVTEVGSISQLMAEQKGLRFDLDELSDLPEFVDIDGTRLRQVLWNLMSNAIKFTSEGGVVLSVSADVQDGLAEIIFEVEDSGIGIPEQELDKIFAMYYQVKSKDNNLHALGTGIGLAVSRQWVQMMHGDITVDSELGHGSTFTVTITVPLADGIESEEEGVTTAHRALQILMVEDIELNITVAKSLLENLGHNVSVARNGHEALEHFQPEEFDLILLDIQLPDMTGFDIAKQWRLSCSHLPPVIALTANLMKDKQQYLDSGMDDALSKPLNVKAISQVLSQYCPEADLPMPEETEVRVAPDYEDILDLDMLESYVDIVGTKPVYDSIAMFEKLMPDYMAILDSNMTAKDQKGIASEAHKIKGAAGSVGLKHIQQIAQKAQSPEQPAWWENIEDWIEQIRAGYPEDIKMLKQWLDAQVDG